LQPTHCKTLAFGGVQVHKEGVLGANSRTKKIRKDFIANPSQTLHLESMNARVLPSLCRLALPVLVAAALHPASAQNATTIPVGYIKSVSLGANSTSNITANTEVAVSLPLKRPVVFASAVASVSGANVTIQNATFGAGNLTTEPHLLEIASGTGEGVSGVITSHNSTTCVVDLPSGLTFNGVVANDAVRIRKAWTLGSFFANATVPLGVEVQLRSGTVAGIRIAPDVLYQYDGIGWLDLNTFDYADNAVLYPGEMILLKNSSGSTLQNLVLVGEVPAYKTKLPLVNLNPSQAQDLFIAYNSPVPETLSNSSITATAQSGDEIQLIDNSATGTNKAPVELYQWDGSGWLDLNSFEYADDNQVLKPGTGFLYRRSATGTGATWEQNPSYLPLN